MSKKRKVKIPLWLIIVLAEVIVCVTLALSQLVKDRDITEELKAANSLLWIQEMNNAKQNAEEIVLNEIIYL